MRHASLQLFFASSSQVSKMRQIRPPGMSTFPLNTHAHFPASRQRINSHVDLWVPARTDRSPDLESMLRRLLIHTLKAQLALRELVCSSLVTAYANENLTDAQKADIVDRWNTTVMERHQLRLLLEAQESVQEDAEQQVKSLS
jgi:hypothetical protein